MQRAGQQRCVAPDFRDYQNIGDLEHIYAQQPEQMPPQENSDSVQFRPPSSPNSDAIYIHRQTVESILRKQMAHINSNPSSGSSASSATSGANDLKIAMTASANTPRCRDSGNWSGDRNSASSSSSTTMDNPYLYIMGRTQKYIHQLHTTSTLLKHYLDCSSMLAFIQYRSFCHPMALEHKLRR